MKNELDLRSLSDAELFRQTAEALRARDARILSVARSSSDRLWLHQQGFHEGQFLPESALPNPYLAALEAPEPDQ